MNRWNQLSEVVANLPANLFWFRSNAMEIPYTVSTRPDTGLWNAKIGIWLFLASEVMLFGALFSAYIFLRIDAAPGTWPHGLLNVPVGTMNTAILILSSVTVVLAWAALKMRRYRAYWWYMLATILCGVIFLTVKLAYEWPQKFEHFGAYIKPEALWKYEKYLGNQRRAEKGLEPRIEITGHLHSQNAKEYEVALDPVNAEPANPLWDRPPFSPLPATSKLATLGQERHDREGSRPAREDVFADAQCLFPELLHHRGSARIARAWRRPRI